MTMTIYGSFVASDLRHYACAQSAQMPIKSKSAVTFAISSSCYYLLGLGLVLLCRLSLFVVYAIFVLEMGNQVGLFVVSVDCTS